MDYGKIAYLKAVDLEKQLLDIKVNINNVPRSIVKVASIDKNLSGYFVIDRLPFISYDKKVFAEYCLSVSSDKVKDMSLELFINDELKDEKSFTLINGNNELNFRSYISELDKIENECVLYVRTVEPIMIHRLELTISGKKIFEKE